MTITVATCCRWSGRQLKRIKCAITSTGKVDRVPIVMSGYQARKSRLQAAGKSAVDSAALQEHLVQNLNLGDPFGRSKRR